ncbi:MAG TPA: DNA primase, partial [Candidatus Caenarcaniphilales bacterium]
VSVREQLYEILALAQRFYEHALHQPQGQAALAYLRCERQLNEATIQQFQLGYAPAGWEVLFGYLVEQKHLPLELVERCGLIVPRQSGGGYYDRFRDRLMIPIHDLQGRTIGFGSRTLTNETPKYLNSPETELFNKGQVLFALDHARAAIVKQDRAVVVEGYFDAISLHAAGITNVVASMGTALTLEQMRQLLRYSESKQIVLNFDADAAGRKAAERAIDEIQDLAYRGEVQLRILNIPDGKDADEFLKVHAVERYQELLDAAPLWLDWQIQQTLLAQDLKQADQFRRATQQIVQLLGHLSDATLRTHYIHRCAELLSQGDSRLVPLHTENLIVQVRRKRRQLLNGSDNNSSSQILPVASASNLLEQAESLLLRVYLHHPECRRAVMDALEARDLQFGFTHHRFLWRKILEITADLEQLPTNLISQLQDHCIEFAPQMAQVYHLFHLDEKTERDTLHPSCIIQAATACMERVICEKRYRQFIKLWQTTDCSTATEVSQFYQQQIYREKRRMEELDQQRVNFTNLVVSPALSF